MMAAARLTWLASALLFAAPGEVLAQYAPTSPPPTYPQQMVVQVHPEPRVELNGLVGYQVTSDVNTEGGTIQVDGGVSYGVALDFKMRPGYDAELLWVWAPTQAHFDSNLLGFGSTLPADVDIHYIQIGGIRSFRAGIVEPFVAGALGAAIIAPSTVTFIGGTRFDPSTTWRLGFNLGVGFSLWLLDRPGDRVKIALRGDARLMAPIYFTSASFYGGTGGSGFAVSGGIPFVQGNFTGALDIAF